MTRLDQFSYICFVAITSLGLLIQPAFGQQLSEEMRDIFEEMIPAMDSDLREKLREAIRDGNDYVELTPDQFKRFRDNPSNPFEGWNGINPDEIDGVIRLQFETQPIRTRKASRWERQAENHLNSFAPIVAQAAESTVRVTNGKAQVALGTIISADGHILTKLSEIKEHGQLFCKTQNGKKWAAQIVSENIANDIALLKIEAKQLAPVNLALEQPNPGAFIFSTDGGQLPLALGVYSNPPRSLIAKNQAFLGVKPDPAPNGVKVARVTEGSSAEDAGIQIGDVITTINGIKLSSIEDLVQSIRQNSPGDKVIIQYLRNGKAGETLATLAGRNVGGPTADRFKMMESFGAIPSKRRDEFPMVFQHDTPILPEQCGGPVVDLHGRVIGINIARGGRVASYAIPANHLKTLIGELMRPSVASPPSTERAR